MKCGDKSPHSKSSDRPGYHFGGDRMPGGVPVKIVSEGHAIKAAAALGGNHGGHKIDRLDGQIADQA